MTINPKHTKNLGKYIVPLAVVIVGAGIFRLSLAKDLEQVNDSALQLQKIEVHQTDNAFYDLKSLSVSQEDKTTATTLLQEKSTNTAAIQQLTDRYRQEITAFETASQKKYYQDPLTSDPSTYRPTSPVSQMNQLQTLARLVSLDAKLKKGKGDKLGADRQVEAIVKTGYLVANGQGTLIQYLVGTAMLKQGFQIAHELGLDISPYSTKADTSRAAYKAIAAEYLMMSPGFNSLHQWETGISVDEKGQTLPEYSLAKYDHLPFKVYFYQPNRTKQIYADQMTQIATYVSAKCSDTTPWKEVKVKSVPAYRAFFTENYVGNTLLSLVTTDLSNVKTKRCEVEGLAQQ